MSTNASQDLSTRHASAGEVFRMALPIILSMLSMSLLGLVDTFFMGWIGPNAQAAVGLGSPSIFSLLALSFGTLSGLTTFVSQFYGAKKYSNCGNILWHGIYLALLFGLGSLCLIIPLWDLLCFIQVNPDFIHETYDYIRIRLMAAPWLFVSFSLISYLRGLGDMKTPAIVSAITVFINIPLTYVFTFGFAGIPAYGVAGAAIGTIIAQALELVLYAAVVFNRRNACLYDTRHIVVPKLATYLAFLKVSFPVGISWALEHFGWLVFGFYIATLSKEEAAANAIIQVFMNVAFMPGLAISIAAMTLVGQYMGAKNIRSAEQSTYYSMFMSIGCLVSLGLLFMILRYHIAGMFSGDAKVVEITANLFFIGAVYQVFDAMGVTTSGALRGAGDTRFPMLIQLLAIWFVMVPLIFYFGPKWGVYGAWIAASIATIVMGLCYYLRFRTGKWKSMGVTEPAE